MAPVREDPLERFRRKVNHDPATGCWNYTGGRSAAGYGTFWGGQRNEVAHRFAYRAYVGEIEPGFAIDHLCRNTSCVNPEHLEAVSLQENNARSESIPAQNARKTHCKNGHLLDEENTYFATHRSGNTTRRCRICQKGQTRRTYQQNKADFKRVREALSDLVSVVENLPIFEAEEALPGVLMTARHVLEET